MFSQMLRYTKASLLIAAALVGSAAADELKCLPFPAVLPATAPTVTMNDGCPDRSSALALLARIRSSGGGDDPVLRGREVNGKYYFTFRPKDVGVTLPVIISCFDTYVGTVSEARK